MSLIYIILEKTSNNTAVKENIISQLQSEQGIETQAKMKGIMFETLFAAMTIQQGPFFIINEYKAGNMQIYEETLIFKLIKIFPPKMFEEIFEQANGKMEELENGSV